MKTKLIQIQMKNFADPFSDEWRLRPFCSRATCGQARFSFRQIPWIELQKTIMCSARTIYVNRGEEKALRLKNYLDLRPPWPPVASARPPTTCTTWGWWTQTVSLPACQPSTCQKFALNTHLCNQAFANTLARSCMNDGGLKHNQWLESSYDWYIYICKIANMFLVTAQWSFVTFYNNQDLVVSGDWKETGHLGVLSTEN